MYIEPTPEQTRVAHIGAEQHVERIARHLDFLDSEIKAIEAAGIDLDPADGLVAPYLRALGGLPGDLPVDQAQEFEACVSLGEVGLNPRLVDDPASVDYLSLSHRCGAVRGAADRRGAS